MLVSFTVAVLPQPGGRGAVRFGEQWICLLQSGLSVDTPAEHGLHRTPYNRLVRWNRVFAGWAGRKEQKGRLMIGAAHLKAHRTAPPLLQEQLLPPHIGRTRGGLNSKLHAAPDERGRPLVMLLSRGQRSGPRRRSADARRLVA